LRFRRCLSHRVASLSEPRRGTDANRRRSGVSQSRTEEKPMGLFSKDIATMDDLFLHGLKDIFYAENQIVKALPKMIDKVTNRDLTKGLNQHLEETKKQIERLEQVFRLLGEEPKAVKCPAIDGLIDEVAGEVDDKNVLHASRAIRNARNSFGSNAASPRSRQGTIEI